MTMVFILSTGSYPRRHMCPRPIHLRVAGKYRKVRAHRYILTDFVVYDGSFSAMNTRKSWREKMDNPNLPKVAPVPPKMQKRFGTGAMLIPSPRQVDALIRTVSEGSVVTVSKMREFLAGKNAADVTCPLATGIFVRIAAEAAEEEAEAGGTGITPYWR